MQNSKNLCSVEELLRRLGETDLKVIDSSWYMPAAQRETHSEFTQAHIPSAQFFHIDLVCDTSSDLPHMLPSAEQFAAAVGALGVSNQSDVVVYDSAGLFSAARVWWMFKVFGHTRVRVLNGGLPAWQAGGGAIAKQPESPRLTKYVAQLNLDLVADKARMQANCGTSNCVVLDARSSARFYGKAPEPRPGLSSGHMPASQSLPFDQLTRNGKMLATRDLCTLFNGMGIDADTKIITSCGSGVTAAIITLALAEAGLGMHRLYDGAWSEWASSQDTIIVDGNL